LNTKVSQGNVATRLRGGGICDHYFIANLVLSPLVNKFRKLFNIWRNYGQE